MNKRTACSLVILLALNWGVNSLQAMETVSRAAESNQIIEWYTLAQQLFTLDADDKDIDKALDYYNLVTSNAHSREYQARAHVALGEIFYIRHHDERAFHHFQTAVSLDADLFATTYSQLRLGQMFLWGQFVKEDFERAFVLLKKVDEQDEMPGIKAAARFLIGEMYHVGIGVKENCGKAEQCFLYAATQNHNLVVQADGCWRLGELWLNGSQDVPQNTKAAFTYLSKAAEQSLNSRAQRISCVYLAQEYVLGRHVSKDLNKAQELLEGVVKRRGNQDFDQWALVRLSEILQMKNRIDEAREYLLIASEQKIDARAARKAKKMLAHF